MVAGARIGATAGATGGATGGELTIVPASADRWPAVRLLLDGDQDRGCWCQPWRGLARLPGEPRLTRPQKLLAQIEAGPPAPGYLAYLGEVPVGWCGAAIRGATPRLDASRVIPALDELPVWAIGCFRIRVGYRRMGVARALLAGVIEAAREAGAPGVEAYPIDPDGSRVDVGSAYVGIASMFDAAGFRRVQLTDARSAGLRRWLVRLDLRGGPAAI